jgi:hypothetical protein
MFEAAAIRSVSLHGTTDRTDGRRIRVAADAGSIPRNTRLFLRKQSGGSAPEAQTDYVDDRLELDDPLKKALPPLPTFVSEETTVCRELL